jgi:hypothetical protein
VQALAHGVRVWRSVAMNYTRWEITKIDNRDINSIEAGAGHQADIDLAAGG